MMGIKFDYPTDQRDFLDTTLTGWMDEIIEVRGGTTYVSKAGGGEQDAIIVVQLHE